MNKWFSDLETLETLLGVEHKVTKAHRKLVHTLVEYELEKQPKMVKSVLVCDKIGGTRDDR